VIAFARAAAADPAPRVVQLTEEARSASRQGNCGVIEGLGALVRADDPAYYANVFAVDPVIGACRPGVDTTEPIVKPVTIYGDGTIVPSDLDAPLPPPPPHTCKSVRGYAEPALSSVPNEGSVFLRNSFGAWFDTCEDDHPSLGIRLGGRLDIPLHFPTHHWSVIGADLEVTYPIAKDVNVGLDLDLGVGGNSATWTSVGLRVRWPDVYLAVDAVHLAANADPSLDPSYGSWNGAMVSVGLAGNAGTNVIRYGELAPLYVALLIVASLAAMKPTD
jgi:hypothetical protein